MADLNTTKACIPMGLLCASVGGPFGLWISLAAIGEGYGPFMFAAPLAAFVTGCFFWWLFVVRRDRQLSVLPAVAAGVSTAVVSHYLCWYLLLVMDFFWGLLTGHERSLINPFHAFYAAGVYSFFSLLFYGWVTIPLGALLGFSLVIFQRRSRKTRPTAV